MTKINESKWNPIKLQESSKNTGYSINSFEKSGSWYQAEIQNDGTRFLRLKRYEDADRSSVEISKALDTIAEDISSSNADDEDIFYFDWPDETKVKKGTIKLHNNVLDMWDRRTEMSEKLYDRVRYALKYGSKFFRKNKDGTIKHLPTERMIGYILSKQDDETITHYVYDPDGALIDEQLNNRKEYGIHQQAKKQMDYQVIPVDELLIFKVGDGPFGTSIIERVYRTWRQMALIEDAIIVYRVVRAPERRVYYIDTGNLQGPKREQAIEKQRLRLMQKQNAKSSQGHVESEFDPHSTGEDIFIPTNSSGKGSRIETLPSGNALGELNDLKWFANKMAAGLRVPKSMTDIQTEDEQHQFTDMRVGSMYQAEMRYMGMVKRYSRAIAKELKDNLIQFAKERDIILDDDADFKINDANSFALYKQMELDQQALNIAASSSQFNSLSKKYVFQKYLQMDAEDIQHNEYERLKELGLADEQIKDMPSEHVSNLVYSDDPSEDIQKEYGITAGGGGGGMF